MTTPHRNVALALCLGLSAGLAGCGASIPSLTTGSLFGGEAAKNAAPQVTNDPTSRAMQVGSTSARAIKCGFNFDPVKLRTQFLATETPTLTNPADADKLGRMYDVAFNGISKAVADQGEGYCTPSKTGKIKEALNRHLTGDYTPTPPEPVVEDSGGLFGDVGSSSGSTYKDSNPWKRDE
jgi:hypothetical protein